MQQVKGEKWRSFCRHAFLQQQQGDTGVITTAHGSAKVVDTIMTPRDRCKARGRSHDRKRDSDRAGCCG